MSSLRLIYIKRITYTVTGLSSIQVYTEKEGKRYLYSPTWPFCLCYNR